jgi:hypothetical protein
MKSFQFLLVLALLAFAMSTVVAGVINSRLAELIPGLDLSDSPQTTSSVAYVVAFERPAQRGDLTLHGLWPQSKINCSNEQFDPKLVAPIRDEMNKFWYSYKAHTSEADEVFWSHEWSKHGTCYKQSHPGTTQLEYFAKALDIHHNIGMIYCDEPQFCDCRCDLDENFKIVGKCTQKGNSPPV